MTSRTPHAATWRLALGLGLACGLALTGCNGQVLGTGPGAGNGPGAGPGNGTSTGPGAVAGPEYRGQIPIPPAASPLVPLSEPERKALEEALFDEYHALAVYDRVLSDHGATAMPFVNIRVSELGHIDALKALYSRYGLTAPAEDAAFKAPSFPTLQAAYVAGAEAERANIALYVKLLAVVAHDDMKAVFTELQAASRDRHLTAFERFASGS